MYSSASESLRADIRESECVTNSFRISVQLFAEFGSTSGDYLDSLAKGCVPFNTLQLLHSVQQGEPVPYLVVSRNVRTPQELSAEGDISIRS